MISSSILISLQHQPVPSQNSRLLAGTGLVAAKHLVKRPRRRLQTLRPLSQQLHAGRGKAHGHLPSRSQRLIGRGGSICVQGNALRKM